MSTPAQSQAEPLPDVLDATSQSGQRAARTRWWFIAGLLVIAPLVLALTAILAVVLWLMSIHGAAMRQVNAEVARIQAAGEPILTADLYDRSRVPAGTSDITPLWLAALGSVNEQHFGADAKGLPIVGQDPSNDLPAEHVAAAEAFLVKYDPTVELTLTAARAEGECRLAVEFDDGFSALLPNVQKMRTLARLMQLRARVAVAKGDTEAAVESVEAIFESSRALAQQQLLIEHLVRMAIANVALAEVEFLLNEAELSDEQLARLRKHVEALDFQQGLVNSVMGERAMGYYIFHHLETMHGDQPFTGKPDPGPGSITKAEDCRMYLELQRQMLDAAREPFPAGLEKEKQVEQQVRLLAGTSNPLEKLNYMTTLLIMPASSGAFAATARNAAQRDLVLCAIAARQYQASRGEPPASLAALVPEFLPAVPADPFDGRPLRLIADGEGLTFYSVGSDQKDDGGLESEQRSGEPDIVVQLK